MRLKLRVGDERHYSKTEIDLIIKEVRVRENKLNEQDEIIELCFKDGAASGILEVKQEELATLANRVRDTMKATRHTREE